MRRSQSRAPQSRKPRFEYTLDEWQRIEAACPGGLSEQARRSLIVAAIKYRALFGGHDFLKRHRTKRQRDWTAVGKSAVQLRGAIARATTGSDRWFEPYLEKLQIALSRLEADAEVYANPSGAAATQQDAREEYYRAVFSVWADEIGRDVTYTYDVTRRESIRGDLVRFFKGVTDPVLGDRAPKNSSLKAIFDREIKRRKIIELSNGQKAPARIVRAAH